MIKDGVFIIAELSANHEQNLDLAIRSIHAAKDAGADAVKIQTFTPDSMTLDSEKPWFRTREDSLWAGQKLYDLYKKAYTPWEWHKKLQQVAKDVHIDFFSTPFDVKTVDKLEELNMPFYKVASLEINHIPLIKRIAATGKPIIISTGVAEKEDIQLAIDTCRQQGNNQIILLKCTSAYPTPLDEVNLNLIPKMKKDFQVEVGLSDHTLGIEIPVAAVALGAKVIEKHFVLDKKNSASVDKDFSLDITEFTEMVKAVRNTEQALGLADYNLTPKARSAKQSARSVFAVEDINPGDIFNESNIRCLRPNKGLHPKFYEEILGKKAKVFIEKGEPISTNHFSG